MKRKWILALLIVAAAVGLSACSCEHQWKDATCREPKTCTLCGETTGSILTHDYAPATCMEPETCKLCGETQGEATGHDYVEATCTTPETCMICGETQGEATGHDYVEATCTTAQYCKVCEEEDGSPLGHDFTEATYEAPSICQRCGETKGEVLQLSSTCDKVLVRVTEKDGSVYELVANEKESYAGVQAEIGIIKDNRWVLEMTSDHPFVDKDGTIFGGANSIYNPPECIYIGNDCFLIIANKKSVIYNAVTKQYHIELYEEYGKDDYHPALSGDCLEYANVLHKPHNPNSNILNKESSLLLIDIGNVPTGGRYVELLDTNTMSVSEIVLTDKQFRDEFSDHYYPVSEGLFAIIAKGLRFYDTNGNEVMEVKLTLYEGTRQALCFKDGKCAAYVKNPNGTIYYVTIDRNGNVISSEEVDELIFKNWEYQTFPETPY